MSNNLEPQAVNRLVRWFSHIALLPKRAWLRQRLRRPVLERVGDRQFLILPNVFNPVVFRTGRYLAEYLQTMQRPKDGANDQQAMAFDVGTGCGIHAIFAAELGYRVEAVEISSTAVRCARINTMLNDCESQVSVRQGDLFEVIESESFDLVMCSLPKFRGTPKNEFEVGWRSADVIDRFTAGLPGVLSPDGVALVLLTSHGDERGMLDGLLAAGLSVEIAQRKHFGVEIMTIYSVTHPQRVAGN